MGLNDVVFERNKSGLGTPLASRDNVSGLVFYNDVYPSGFSATEAVKKIFSLEEAEDAGIIEGSVDHSVEWYHIREFFEKNPRGEVYVGFYAVPATPETHNFEEIKTVQDFAEGEIRQLGVYYPLAEISSGLIGSIQSVVTELQGFHKPLNVIAAFNLFPVTDLTTLIDLRTLTSNNVSVTIGQDGGAKGKTLFNSLNKSISDLGSKLGAVSSANVNESIAWVEEFPMVTDGFELDTIDFSNGQSYKDLSENLINGLDEKGYIFLVKHVGYAGTFNNDSYTAAPETNDLSTIENNRTIDKAVRNTRSFILPKLGSPLFIDGQSGQLTQDTIAVFRSLADRALSPMKADGEISDYAVIINPNQNVLQTSTLVITLEIVPVGVARAIKVNVGFVPKIN